jgi:hypothetical protein
MPIEDSGGTMKKWVETWKMEAPHDHVAFSHSDKWSHEVNLQRPTVQRPIGIRNPLLHHKSRRFDMRGDRFAGKGQYLSTTWTRTEFRTGSKPADKTKPSPFSTPTNNLYWVKTRYFYLALSQSFLTIRIPSLQQFSKSVFWTLRDQEVRSWMEESMKQKQLHLD